jgi:Na+-transporting methylmalonyl-CoA/oxaloacetate decarboxylase gamma subunit
MFLEQVSEITTIPEALVNTLIGMGTVFSVLILISFIIYLMKFIPMLLGGGKKEAVKPNVPAAQPLKNENPAPERRQEMAPASVPADDMQLIAVIAAAIAASMEEETGTPVAPDGLMIRSIKKRTFSL